MQFALKSLAALLLAGLVWQTSLPQNTAKAEMGIEKSEFGKTSDGKTVDLYRLTNGGMHVNLITLGATVQSVEVPNSKGKLENITLGFDTVKGYEDHGSYFGCTTGRFCNRIGKGKFELSGKTYTLATNDGDNHLHGGASGFNRKLWTAKPIETKDTVGVQFAYTSPDGEEGYPGKLDVVVTYTLNDKNELRIDYEAKTDKDTVLNLTNHCYWNLQSAETKSLIKDVMLTVAADKFLEGDSSLLPTGKLLSVKGTPLDFTEPKAMGKQLMEIKSDPVGYDHCFVLRSEKVREPLSETEKDICFAAKVSEPDSGRTMEIYTDQPGLQFYTGNFLDGSDANGGNPQYGAFCLETQHYPDSPNRPEFPSTVLKPGETFKSSTVHRFGIVTP